MTDTRRPPSSATPGGAPDDFALRHVPFGACFNFRDIGGYETAGDGNAGAPHGRRRVRWGRVYRSGALHRMTPEDVERACGLDLSTVIDLRRPDEVRNGSHLPLAEHGVRRLSVPVVPEGGSEILDGRYGRGISGGRYIGYLELGAERFTEVFRALAEPSAYAAVVHCSAGKDRTGAVVAMLLELLGVDRETIVRDYELTNREVDRQFRWLLQTGRLSEDHLRDGSGALDHEGFRRSLSVPGEAIAVFLDHLRQEYGSAEGFLRAHGLPGEAVEAIREHLLEPAGR